jgi:hypothetical protein
MRPTPTTTGMVAKKKATAADPFAGLGTYYKDDDFIILEDPSSGWWLPRLLASKQKDESQAEYWPQETEAEVNNSAEWKGSLVAKAKPSSGLFPSRSTAGVTSTKSRRLTASPDRIVLALGVAALLKVALSRWWMDHVKKVSPALNTSVAVEAVSTPEAADEEQKTEAWQERYELLSAETADLQQQLQAAEQRAVAAADESAEQRGTAAYWETVARNHQAELQAAVERERLHAMKQLRQLKEAMVAVVEQERVDMLADFQAQIAQLQKSLLQQQNEA